MKYLNYLILAIVFLILSSLVFNHVNAVAGVVLVVGGCYFVLSKLIKLIKEKWNV